MKDVRDETIWVVLELSKFGELTLSEGTLEKVLRKHLDCPAAHKVFIPAILHTEFDSRKTVVSVAEGYVFVEAGLSDSIYYTLESTPYIKKVLSSRDPKTGMRVLMTLKDKDLDVIRKKLESFVSSTVKEGMKVLVQKGPFSGIEANVIMAEDETFYISVEMRSLRLIIGVPKNAVKPLKK
jgi:transcription antitermination factor NusG